MAENFRIKLPPLDTYKLPAESNARLSATDPGCDKVAKTPRSAPVGENSRIVS